MGLTLPLSTKILSCLALSVSCLVLSCLVFSYLVLSWLCFLAQLAPQSATKSMKKSMPRWLPMLTSFFDRFLIGFCSQLRPQNLKNQAPAAARARFLKKTLFAICIDFSSILVPICIHFRSKNQPTSLQKSILEGISFWIDFCIDF